jgi:hypothetical protein
MEYKSASGITHEEAEIIFARGSSAEIASALVGLAFHDSDDRWVENKCILLASHTNPEVRQIAATCLGHLGRIHQRLDLKTVIPLLIHLTKDDNQDVAGSAGDAIDDIEMFMGYKADRSDPNACISDRA